MVASPLLHRSGKISLPARMTDLYQSYPDDADGITIPSVPEIVLTRPSIVSECSGENSSRQSENSNNWYKNMKTCELSRLWLLINTSSLHTCSVIFLTKIRAILWKYKDLLPHPLFISKKQKWWKKQRWKLFIIY